jgi:outer membrane protein assembly factor BamA
MLRKTVLCLATVLAGIYAQEASFPLESVVIEGSRMPRDTVLEITGFRLGAPINKAALEQGCAKLRDSGIFQDINYRYGPGPKHGYVVTLTLADQSGLAEAAIDIPGADEDEIWRWLTSKYPVFDHKVPGDDAAQQFLAHQIETHAGAKLKGQPLVAKMETEFVPRRRLVISFQPATLPRITTMSFTGNQELTSVDLARIMQKVAAGEGYTDRRFRSFTELNLRPAYEEHGMYRVKFPSIAVQNVDSSSVAVTVAIEEGAKFNLGEVHIIGADLPIDAMRAAAGFQKGKVANWTEIQNGIWAMEKPVKRTGYTDATARPERVLHDDERILELNISFYKGPLYRFGQLRIVGLSPDLEGRARKTWKLEPGSPYDYAYSTDFFREFSKSVDFRQFKKVDVKSQKGSGDHVMDVTLTFEPK